MSVTLLMAVGFFLMLRKSALHSLTILAIVWLCHLVDFSSCEDDQDRMREQI